MASLSPEELKSLAQDKPVEEVKAEPPLEKVESALPDTSIAKLLGGEKKKSESISSSLLNDHSFEDSTFKINVKSAEDSTKDFKKRAEEIEAAHLLKVKAES
jgi:hypothetical protein